MTSEHAGANLFLLSRSGITVGETGQFFDLPAGLTLSTADQVRFGQGDFPTDASPWSAAGCCQGPPQALIFEETGTDDALSEIVLGSEQPSGGLGDFNAFTAVADRIRLSERRIQVPGTMIRLAATGREGVEVSLVRDAAIPDWVAARSTDWRPS